MKRKSLYLLLFLFVGLGLGVWYLLNRSDPKMEAILAERDFAIEDIDEVGKIFLANRDSTPITLELMKGVWMVNNQYKANPNAIKNLLQTIQDIKMQSIPPKGHVKGIMEGLAVYGIKVEIYSKRQELLKTYYVGSGTHNEYGTYFFKEHGSQPYIMEVPHFAGNIRERYDLSLLDWRDRSLMDVPFEEINQVEVIYLDEQSESFTIKKVETRYVLLDGAQQEIKVKPSIKKNIVNYLKEFTEYGVESIQNDHPQRNQISKLEPFCKVVIHRTTTPEPLICKFYPIVADSAGLASQQINQSHLKRGNFFRMHVIRSDGDFMLVQYPAIEKLFRSVQSFQ